MTANAIQQPTSRAVIFSLLTLLSGIVIGAGITLIFVGLPSEESAPPGPEYFSRRMVAHLTRELGLTESQQAQIRNIIEAHMTVLDAIRDEARPKVRQELDAMNTEILALLDKNQQQMWKDRIERMQQRFREARQRRGRRDGDRRGRDRDDRDRDRDRDDRGRFGRGDPNSPFYRDREQGRFGRRGGDGDPNSPFFRRRRPPDGMRPGPMPPNQ